ncbi:MAG: TonB-dependent receptor, partial [Bacteroidota bacterium]
MKLSVAFKYKITLSSLCLLFLAFIPRSEDPVARLVTVLQRWTDSIPQEKVYLQTDKPYYVLGDTIWFKGYVTIGSRHQLSALSGSLYVDLINEQDSVLRSLKLPVIAGMAIGDFILGDDYKQGSYRIRSYTQWMRNAGDEYFFDRTFTIGDLVSNNTIVKADYGYKQVDGKPVLSAMLNYANDEGKPIAGKDVHYQVIIDKKVVWSRSATTDASGNIPVNIVNDKQAN